MDASAELLDGDATPLKRDGACDKGALNGRTGIVGPDQAARNEEPLRVVSRRSAEVPMDDVRRPRRTDATPALVINPPRNSAFAALAHRLVTLEGMTPGRLQAELRTVFPRARVHARALSSEYPAWYVYREGVWIGTE